VHKWPDKGFFSLGTVSPITLGQVFAMSNSSGAPPLYIGGMEVKAAPLKESCIKRNFVALKPTLIADSFLY